MYTILKLYAILETMYLHPQLHSSFSVLASPSLFFFLSLSLSPPLPVFSNLPHIRLALLIVVQHFVFKHPLL